jgi:hypothetical protein
MLAISDDMTYRLTLREQKYQVIKTPKLDDVFTKQTLDTDDFLSQRGYCSREFQMQRKQTLDIDDFLSQQGEDCLREFQRQQEIMDRVKPSMHHALRE